MKKEARYIVTALLCMLFILAALLLIAPAERVTAHEDETAEEVGTENEKEPPKGTEQTRRFAHKPVERLMVYLDDEYDETPSETESEAADGEETVNVDYRQLVDTEEWREPLIYLTKMAQGEFNRTETPEEKMQCAATAWCVLWRKDDTSGLFRNDVISVITQEGQFHGYREDNWVNPAVYDIMLDTVGRYIAYKNGASLEDIDCVLPPEYLWFHGARGQNWFRDAYEGEFAVWDWSWSNPYEEDSE